MPAAASPRHFGRTILRTCGAAATRPGSGFFFPDGREEVGVCRPRRTHRLPEWTGWDAAVAFHGGFLKSAHSGRPGSPGESVLGAAWQRQFNDPFPKRRCHEQTERGGCIPKVAVWVSLDTVLDAFLVRASPADAKPIASRGLYRPISDRAAPPALASGRGALEMGWRWGWNLPCWGPCSPDGQQAGRGRRGRLPMASENGQQSF